MLLASLDMLAECHIYNKLYFPMKSSLDNLMENSFYHFWSLLINLPGLWFAGYWLFCSLCCLHGKGIPSLWYQIVLLVCSAIIVMYRYVYFILSFSVFEINVQSNEAGDLKCYPHLNIYLGLSHIFFCFDPYSDAKIVSGFDEVLIVLWCCRNIIENITEVEEIDGVWVSLWVIERLRRSHGGVKYTRKPSRFFEIPWWKYLLP